MGIFDKKVFIEAIAKAIHEDYVQKQVKEGKTPQTNPSMVDWEELPEHLKESNRQQADHIGEKLKAVGCEIIPAKNQGEKLFEFTPEEIELLAEKEHKRWVEERKRDGWKPGQKKDVEKKITPYLIPYNNLPEEIKELDRNAVRNIPALIAKAGFQIRHISQKPQ